WPHLASASWVFAECNLSAEVIAALIARKATARFRLAVDAVSNEKSHRLPHDLSGIDVLFLNGKEANAYLAHTGCPAAESPEAAARALIEAGAGEVVMTSGADGFVVASAGRVIRRPAVRATVIDVVGAGDAMIAG